MRSRSRSVSAPDLALRRALHGERLGALLAEAARLRDAGHGEILSFSRKVFIPLTRLCRNSCRYCSFARGPRPDAAAFLAPDEVLEIARAGARAGCREALFTLGDKPELRHQAARAQLAALDYPDTLSYLAAMCALVLRETPLLPHANPGVLSREGLARLREVTVSQGMMLESSSPRLLEDGQAHCGSPDKVPALRLASIRAAGELKIPFTSGILIGIGETRDERIDALLALRDLHREHGHLQEVIVQVFRPKPGTAMASAAAPDLVELQWTIAAARLIFGEGMNIQAPPNLSPAERPQLVAAGINDWGGISPVTPDHVNPEAPWPDLDTLAREASGKVLVERLAVYPAYARDPARWQSEAVAPRVLAASDADGYARTDSWSPGLAFPPELRQQRAVRVPTAIPPSVREAIDRARQGDALSQREVELLLAARGDAFHGVCEGADALRREVCGDVVRYVVNRNINYTNVCAHRCSFCAFCRGVKDDRSRGSSYDLAPDEVARRAREAWDRGATEVCMQGGIHPDYTGETYLSLVRAVKQAAPQLHVHAFSPLEVVHGATTLDVPVERFLERLRDAGLGSLPGTAAEVLADEVRAVLCPEKLSTARWLDVVGAAHRVGVRTTATIMFGHVDRPAHWARHLLAIRSLQARTGGFTEFVPLPFVHMEAPIYSKGRARKGPTFREAVLMHAVSRLVLHPGIRNIQVSWVKMGGEGVQASLRAGANDLGGTLMNESITRAAGTHHGEEMAPARMDEVARRAGRVPAQRTTLYGTPPPDRTAASYEAAELSPVVLTPSSRRPRRELAG